MVETRSQKRKIEEINISDITISLNNLNNKKTNVNNDISNSSESDSDSDFEFVPETSESSESYYSDSIIEDELFNEKDEDEDELFNKEDNNSLNTNRMKLRKQIRNIFSKAYNNDININNKCEYNKFRKSIDSIFSGEFFEKYNINYTIKELKDTLELEKVSKLNVLLDSLKLKYNTNNIINILNLDLSIEKKQKILELLYKIVNTEILTPEYDSLIKELDYIIKNKESIELIELEKEIMNHINHYNESYKNQILLSNMSFNNKVIAFKFMKIMNSYGQNSSSEEHIKYKTWLNTLLSIPFGKYHNSGISINSPIYDIKKYITNIRTTLDRKLSFLEKPKDQIINVISQLIRNPNSKLNAIGLYGVKGIGKSSLIDSIGYALNRPIKKISLGGSSDSSLLTGHNFTYIGSKQGRIIDAIIDSKVMNPILVFDEIDKISKTEHGHELIGNLVHLTDTTTNNKYNCDNYLSGIELDLSRVLFIFTYNDNESIDPILSDRIYKIKIDNYSIKEKLEITTKHLINNIIKTFNFKNEDIIFTDESINYIINNANSDEGMRSIKSKIQIIISRINTLLLTDNNIINLKYKSLYKYYNKLPATIQKNHIDILLEDSLTECSNSNAPEHMYL